MHSRAKISRIVHRRFYGAVEAIENRQEVAQSISQGGVLEFTLFPLCPLSRIVKISLQASQTIAQAGGFNVLVGDGTVPDVLLDMMRRNDIDLAILGTHGRRAFKKLLLGSIAEEVFRVPPCPVLTIGPRTEPTLSHPELRHILYALEFAPDPSEAAKYAISLAERYGATLTVINVREDMPAGPNKPEKLTEPAEHWVEDHIPSGSDLRQRVRLERGFGSAPAAILDFAAKAAVDVIVMSVKRVDPMLAAHLPKLDTAYEVVSRAPCPVLTIR